MSLFYSRGVVVVRSKREHSKRTDGACYPSLSTRLPPTHGIDKICDLVVDIDDSINEIFLLFFFFLTLASFAWDRRLEDKPASKARWDDLRSVVDVSSSPIIVVNVSSDKVWAYVVARATAVGGVAFNGGI